VDQYGGHSIDQLISNHFRVARNGKKKKKKINRRKKNESKINNSQADEMTCGKYEIGFHALQTDCIKCHDDNARNVNSMSISVRPQCFKFYKRVRLSMKWGHRVSWDHAHEEELKQIICLCKFLANFLFLL
jgi:hypothetical protein